MPGIIIIIFIIFIFVVTSQQYQNSVLSLTHRVLWYSIIQAVLKILAIGPTGLEPPAGARNRRKSPVKIREIAPKGALPRKGLYPIIFNSMIFLWIRAGSNPEYSSKIYWKAR